MDLISGKWKMLIINTLMLGTLHFKQLERAISGINTYAGKGIEVT
ncbi:winged helix-turn-helix transcriptional regulator [Dyadobacter sp. CY261]|nr:winged helix-turn-helix transcriptional regulator [Dyadobacter sp. CY261]MCF0069799.1 winged helix-turn-helix transcriptional regulator [Dyadobacter sp. CY261]